MGSEIVITITGLVCTLISSVVTFLLTRKKYNTEVDSQQITNISEAFKSYKEMMSETVKSQNEKIETLERENKSLRQQIQQLQMQVISLLGKPMGVSSIPTDYSAASESKHSDNND